MKLKYLYLNVIVGLAYYISGQAGLLLAIPPSSAAAVWPAAGIALAAFLICGNLIAPGLFLGILLVQTSSFLDISSPETIISTLILATVISLGGLSQAWLGSKLVQPIFKNDQALLIDRSIFKFSLLTGPVSCMLASTVSIFTLWFSGILPTTEIPISWGTWWIGDSIGVLVFTPIILCFFGKPRAIWKQRIVSVALPLCFLTLVTFSVFKFSYNQQILNLEDKFEKHTITFTNELQNKIKSHIESTKSLKEFYDSSNEVTFEEFTKFVQPKLSRNPDIHALEWIPMVSHIDRKEFEERIGNQIKTPNKKGGMSISPEKEFYFPIEFVEPYAGNENALGFDIRSNPLALIAADASCVSGKVTVTDGIRLVQDKKEQVGIVFYAPIYKKNNQFNSYNDCENISGFAASVFFLENKIKAINEEYSELNLSVSISNNSNLIISNIPEADLAGFVASAFQFKRMNEILVANKKWDITYSPTAGFIKYYSTWIIWVVIISGFVITIFSGIGLLMLTGRTLRTEDQIKLRTNELNNEIKERKYVATLLSIENKTLEMITQDHSLDEMLNSICVEIERILPNSMCSILLLDPDEMHLNHGAAPSLPDEYNEAINGVEIGSSVGSCGTAAYLNEQIIVSNIEEDPLWKDYKELALNHGLRACWSTPISISDEKVLGTFALYFSSVKEPDKKLSSLMERMASIVKIAILRNQTEEKLNFQANHDELTGLINRREFENRATRLLATVKQDMGKHALCFMDLDQFKVVNDTCGHAAGDEMLRQVGSVLRGAVRHRDTLARLGGDEFGVLMEHCSLDDAQRVATSLQQAIQEYQFLWEGRSFRIGVSIGLVPITTSITNLGELLKVADAACYVAKDKGRNRIHVYHADDSELAQRHGEMQWVTRINTALEEDRFCLFAQPIVSLHGGSYRHYELLVRMTDENGDIIPPGAFLPAAERYDLITNIDRWVIDRAFDLLEKNPEFLDQIDYCAINLSGASLADMNFHKFVLNKFNASTITQEKICFEITETAAISNLNTATLFISEMKALGCRFSLDDFGSGLSSFAYLKNMEVDYLKIDGMFVKDIVDDPIDHAMVKSINEVGQVMGMKTIAEFVENDVIKGMLKEIGVDYAQGYGIGKPEPFLELLDSKKL